MTQTKLRSKESILTLTVTPCALRGERRRKRGVWIKVGLRIGRKVRVDPVLALGLTLGLALGISICIGLFILGSGLGIGVRLGLGLGLGLFALLMHAL